MIKEDKKYFDLMDSLDEITPYATYLDQDTLSTVDEWIDTGSMALNAIISRSLYKGIPVGRVTQFAGGSMTGKTFFMQNIMKNAQKMGKFVVVFDSENAIDKEGCTKFGIDPKKVKYISTTTVENTKIAIKQFLEKVSKTEGTQGKFVIIIDNMAQMETELGEKRMSEGNAAADMGTNAKAIKSLLKTCVNWSKISKTTIVVTNEVYGDPSAMYPSLVKHMPGGEGAIYKPSVTIQLGRKPLKANDKDSIDPKLAAGQKGYNAVFLRCYTVKNRFAKQYLEVELYLSFANGLHKTYGLLEIMKDLGVVVLEGKTYKDWKGESLGYYKSWREDKTVWPNLLEELERRIDTEWAYSSVNDEPFDEEGNDEDDSDVKETKVESPLDKLKDIKRKVSAKIDKVEET
jgi:RecA/RadA recombinase